VYVLTFALAIALVHVAEDQLKRRKEQLVA